MFFRTLPIGSEKRMGIHSTDSVRFCLCVQFFEEFHNRIVVFFGVVDADARMGAVIEPNHFFGSVSVRVEVFRLVRRGIGILATVQEQNGLFEPLTDDDGQEKKL